MISVAFLLLFLIQQGDAQNKPSCTASECCDRHELCPHWAELETCKLPLMRSTCKMSCNICSSSRRKVPNDLQEVPNLQPIPNSNPDTEIPIVGIDVVATESPPAPISAPSGLSQIASMGLPIPADQPAVATDGPKLLLGNIPERCEEIRQRNPSKAITLMIQNGLISEVEDSSFRRTLSTQDILASNNQFLCTPSLDTTDCSRNICYNMRYRTMDGTCNNFLTPLSGAASTAFGRLTPSSYDDSIQALNTLNGNRPSTRDVSRFLLSSPQSTMSPMYNTLLMQFGQFIVHDVTKTSLLATDPCVGCTETQGQCSPIVASQTDTRLDCSNMPCCLSFSRASAVCGTGQSTTRIQLNENTAFLDGSVIYGSSLPDSQRLRDGAFLRVTPSNGRNFPPFDQQQCADANNCNINFDTGDNRNSIFLGLAAFQTMFLREHNRVATQLQQQNPQWNADRIFQEARKIVGAEMQVIAYKEWLPKVLGRNFENKIGTYKGYNERLDPSIASEFSHAAMRFGHGMIQDIFSRVDENGQTIPQGNLVFDGNVQRPQRLLFEGGIDPLLRGMMFMPLKRPQRVATSVTESFGAVDLAATNLQRGRDVGLPGYNAIRQFCGLSRAKSFDDFKSQISSENVRSLLQQVYTTPDAIDLYAAVLLEDPVLDGLVGPTPSCLISEQFKRIRDGDRFWYQNPSIFTPQQLAQLEKVTFARILCDNTDGFQTVLAKAFEQVGGFNNLVPCSSIPSLDLSKWME